jgi:hypothetical protein
VKVIHSAGIRQGRELLGDLDESETGAENGDERRRREVFSEGPRSQWRTGDHRKIDEELDS